MTKRARLKHTIRLLRIIMLICAGAMLMVAYVWQRIWTHEIVQEIADYEKDRKAVKAELARLQVLRSRLANYERIRLEAQERSGLLEQQKYVLPVLSECRSLVEEDRRESEKAATIK